MKKLLILFLILFVSANLFSEDIKVKTGDVFGSSMTETPESHKTALSAMKLCQINVINE